MTVTPEQRIGELGLTLPAPAAPAASYIPAKRSGRLLFIAGQVPFVDGKLLVTGKLGASVTTEQGLALARTAALNAVAAAGAEVSHLGCLSVAQVQVFVASLPTFCDQHLVANGASDLLFEIFGEDAGAHPRTAVATPCLPLDAPVEVQVTFWVED